MAKSSESGPERRRHRRYPAANSTRTKSPSQDHSGALKDISISGATIAPGGEFEMGDVIEIDIDDVGTFPGRISRTAEDDTFAVAFDLDEDDEDSLMDEITRIHEGLLNEEF